MLRPTDSPHLSGTSSANHTFSSLSPDLDEKDDSNTTPMSLSEIENKKIFKTIQIGDVDTSSASFNSWPPQIENINLAEIHKEFLKDCNNVNKYKPLINKLSKDNATIWMINSTFVGGGVAEMLPMLISMFKDINITIKWVVISPSSKNAQSFFNITKQIHNNIHGVFNPKTMEILNNSHRLILESVCKDCCNEFIPLVKPQDIIIIHDLQPLAMIKYLKKSLKNLIIWRSHIGIDQENETTDKTWNFLKPYINLADHIIYSLKDYIPKFVIKENKIPYSIIPPAICPFTPKNIELTHSELLRILSKSNIIHPTTNDDQWEYKVQRVCGKTGKLIKCSNHKDNNFELLFNPIICEISRWDKLKGWIQLIKAFVHLKQNINTFIDSDAKHEQYIQNMILVLAGPDPSFIQDDPEGIKVFNDLCTFYKSLGNKYKDIQDKIYILSLPMNNTDENALIVNALQRLSSIVIQNSLREGFGLTVTEAMWKGTPIIASNVGGIRVQCMDGINGININDPTDYKSVAKSINKMISSGDLQMKKYAIAGKKNVIQKFLIWSQCRNYLDTLNYHLIERKK